MNYPQYMFRLSKSVIVFTMQLEVHAVLTIWNYLQKKKWGYLLLQQL